MNLLWIDVSSVTILRILLTHLFETYLYFFSLSIHFMHSVRGEICLPFFFWVDSFRMFFSAGCGMYMDFLFNIRGCFLQNTISGLKNEVLCEVSYLELVWSLLGWDDNKPQTSRKKNEKNQVGCSWWWGEVNSKTM